MRDLRLTAALKVVVAPDSFKGSLDAAGAAAALAKGWKQARPHDALVTLPMADGGEGTLEAIECAVFGSARQTVRRAMGPDGRQVDVDWLTLPGSVVFVELAAVSGLQQMSKLDPLGATTRGLGQVIAAACGTGNEKLLIGLGGSATTDAAMGALRALGLDLRDVKGELLPEGGGALNRLASVSRTRLIRLFGNERGHGVMVGSLVQSGLPA